MRFDHLHLHQQLSRREAIGLGAAAAGLAALGPASDAGAAPAPADGGRDGDRFNDDMFIADDVIAGAWEPSPYGAGDQRGAFNELTPERAGRALGLLKQGRAVHWYQLGEEMFNGFPAFPSVPERRHDMFLYQQGYVPPADFNAGGGISGTPDALGPNKISAHEERFGINYTYQIGTQLDGLGHVGVADWFYNGFRGPALATPTGLSALGNENMGPVITRGVIYDVVGLKVAQRKTNDFFTVVDTDDVEYPVLRGDYRITIDDLRACLDRQRIRKGIGPGDVPLIHTGWTHLARTDPTRYLATEPGIYLAEVRYFADKRPAIIAGDAWGLEVIGNEISGDNLFPCHQELLGKYGIRIGEGFVTDAAIADNVYEGVLIITPQNTPGGTAGSTPPVLLGQPGRRIRD